MRAAQGGGARATGRSASSAGSASRLFLDVGGKAVAAAPDCLDQGRILRVGLDLLAEPADLVVDRALERLEGTAAGQVEEMLPRQDYPRPFEEDREQAKLRGR